MKLGSLVLAHAKITNIRPAKKLTTYEYLWCDENAVEESGLGIRRLTVAGIVSGYSDRDALEAACEVSGEKKLFFPSALGAGDDRYYRVYTQPAVFHPHNPSAFDYTFECLAADPAVYDADTDEVIW